MNVWNKLKGTGVAIVTPFNKKREVDYKSLAMLINHIVLNKVDYVVALGTTGESVTLNNEEKRAVLKAVIKCVNGRVPVVLGIGGNDTASVIASFKDFDLAGVSAILSVSPYYNKPIQNGIYEHYRALSKASPLPIILYNVPGRTGSNITADTTLKLAGDCKNIIGIKEASGNIEQCMDIIKYRPKGFLVISGDDSLTLPIIASGGDGVISVVANAFPKDFSAMVRFALKDNYKEARKLHYKLTDITKCLFIEGNPGGIKAALSIMGICDEYMRLPLVPVGKNTRDSLKQMIKTY